MLLPILLAPLPPLLLNHPQNECQPLPSGTVCAPSASKHVRLLSSWLPWYANADASQNADPDNDIDNDNECASTLLEVHFQVDFTTKGSLLTIPPLPLPPAQAHPVMALTCWTRTHHAPSSPCVHSRPNHMLSIYR